MTAYVDALGKLKESILGNDILILIAGMIALFFYSNGVFAVATNSKIKKWKENPNVDFSRFMVWGLSFCNTFFLTMVTLFPLLGMLGTVVGLLGLDLASEDMSNIKNNFFIALTSTAWGIIFSAAAKFVYAFFADFIEDKIEVTKKLSEEKDNKGTR